MISIIVCSRGSDIPLDLKSSIAETIGCDYELVVIDNAANSFSIFQAYNEGVRRSKGELLCFCHDDVLFLSQDWGKRIASYFESRSDLGLLGVSGAHFLPSVPMYWSSSPFVSEHNLNNDHGLHEEFFHEDYFNDKDIVEVVAVDGLCFFMRSALFERVRFDDSSYAGFHLYDMDICLQVISAGLKVMVCRDILIEHSWSESVKVDEVLEKNLSIFCNKWADFLPISRGIYLPDYTKERINRLCAAANDAKAARHSKAYKLGRFLLNPFRLFISTK